MKKLLFTILFAFSISVNAQYYSITFVNVPQENIAEFQMLETNYWSKVAKANIDAGKQLSWGLVARVGGGTDTWNHAFVNVYETAEQMASANSNYDSMAIIGVDPQDIATFEYVDGSALTHWVMSAFIPGYADFTIWNFAKPTNAFAFVNEQINVWQPAFEKNMGGREYWGAAL